MDSLQRKLSSWFSLLRSRPVRFAHSWYQTEYALCFSVVICVGLMSTTAVSTDYPTKPIRLICPGATGGAPDIVARLIANDLSRQMGQQVVVDNRPGASGIIAFESLARAAHDGYTFGATVFNLVTNPGVHAKLPYDVRDFQSIIQATSGMDLLAVTPSMPLRSVKELIEYAKANPDKLSYGSGTGVASNALEMELFKMMTGTRIARVTYKTIQQAITDVISGQIHMVFDNVPSIMPHVKSGRVRALAVTSLKRNHVLPEVPTLDEAGLLGFERLAWGGYLAPARMPREILMRLNAEINKALILPAVGEKVRAMGYTTVGGTPEQFAGLIGKELDKWSKVIKSVGITAE